MKVNERSKFEVMNSRYCTSFKLLGVTINNKLTFNEHWDVPKKRIPRAEFHGIFLDFVECGMD